METPPENDKAKKEYKKPLTIFEASSYIKGSVPIIDEDSDKSKNEDEEIGNEEGPNIIFSVRRLFY